jgi:hypothetical protein
MVDVVLAGHDHIYDRLLNPKGVAGRAGFPYIVNGIGTRQRVGKLRCGARFAASPAASGPCPASP